MIVVGIDPGTKESGIAVVRWTEGSGRTWDSGQAELLDVRLARAKGRKVPDRRVGMALALKPETWQYQAADFGVVEWQSYRHTDKRPNDIINLCGIAGMAVSALALNGLSVIITPTPGEWTKGIPKGVRTLRALRRVQCTPDSEWFDGMPPSLRHNVFDAIALALWGIDLARAGGLPPPPLPA